MTLILKDSDDNFKAQFQTFVNQRRSHESDCSAIVKNIIMRIQKEGDDALIALTQELDGYNCADAHSLRLSADECAHARSLVSSEARDALCFAKERIFAYHRHQLPADAEFSDDTGAIMGWRFAPMAAAGLYVPGGTAAYPSSVLMNAIPALVAGVKNLVMSVPTPKGDINPLVIEAAHQLGIDHIYRLGGAQAIAALALGTQTIPKMDVIVGPGNQYVAEAKRQLYGRVGIDMIAGPSEVLIFADDSANPAWCAADMLAQAEHDELAQAILITDDEPLAMQTLAELKKQLPDLPRHAIAEQSIREHGAIIILSSKKEAAALIDELAPEHLEIMTQNPQEDMKNIHYAGSVFLGAFAPEAIGDYVAGPNHVLPTSRTARFANPLSVYDFMTRKSTLHLDKNALASMAEAAILLARCEGLEAHARSVEMRLAPASAKL